MKKALSMNANRLRMCAVLLVFLLLAGCCKKQEDISMRIDILDGCTTYNGTAQEFFQVAEGSENTVEVTVHKTSGTLRITISEEADPDNVVYDGHEFPGEFFTVKVTQPGRYRILVHAEDFVGSYQFEYDKMQ